MSTRVYLVGAGPGDPELLTLKALRLLQRADVVLHDDLVSAGILQLIRSDALVQNVGKRCGRKRITQEEIHRRMIGAARNGEMVVRLQGGDPLLFGRAGEEMEALRSAGIDFEVVPGVTAAFAAAASAQIPLTDRRLSSKLIFLTAHNCKQDIPADFGSGISSGATLAIYMPGQNYAQLQEQLLASGVDLETDCLLISHATLPDESSHATTVGRLALAPRLATPAILLVGRMAWPLQQSSIAGESMDDLGNAITSTSREIARESEQGDESDPEMRLVYLSQGQVR